MTIPAEAIVQIEEALANGKSCDVEQVDDVIVVRSYPAGKRADIPFFIPVRSHHEGPAELQLRVRSNDWPEGQVLYETRLDDPVWIVGIKAYVGE